MKPKNDVVRIVSLLFILVIIGCATPEATWKTVPEVKMPYERAWAIVVNAIGERFDIETADAQSGYLRTGWKTTNKDFLGSPIQKTRVVVRVEERNPFKVKVKVEMQEIGLFSEWVDGGNNPKMEQEIIQDLAGRLR